MRRWLRAAAAIFAVAASVEGVDGPSWSCGDALLKEAAHQAGLAVLGVSGGPGQDQAALVAEARSRAEAVCVDLPLHAPRSSDPGESFVGPERRRGRRSLGEEEDPDMLPRADFCAALCAAAAAAADDDGESCGAARQGGCGCEERCEGTTMARPPSPEGRRRVVSVVSYEAATETEVRAALSGQCAATAASIDLSPSGPHISVVDVQLPAVRGEVLVFGAGASASSLVAVGPIAHRLMTVDPGASLILEGLSLEDGVAEGVLGFDDPDGFGGCVYVKAEAVLTATATRFTNCAAVHGGAVFAAPTATVTLQGGALVTNSVASYDGGGITAAGATLTLRGASSVTHCRAGYTAGCISLYADNTFVGIADIVEGATIAECTSGTAGGALTTPTFGRILVSDSLIANSTALVGGGVLAFGGSNKVFVNAHVRRCHAASLSFALGGGLFGSNLIQDPRSLVTVTRGSSITGCTSTGEGGGISMLAGFNLLLDGGSYVRQCSAVIGGGGLAIEEAASLRNESFVAECDAALGGGIMLTSQSARLEVRQGSIWGNVATGRGGGGIFAPKDSHVFLVRSRVEANAAPTGAGGAIASPGGQIWIIGGTVLRQNSARLGGGVALHAGSYFGAGIPTGRHGRLYASGKRCLWVEVRLDFSADSKVDAKNVYAVIRDVATGAVVDARGAVTQVDPVAGELAVSQHCLAPGHNYSLILAASLGGEDEWSSATARISGPLAALVDVGALSASSASPSSSSPPPAPANEVLNSGGVLAAPDPDDWATRQAHAHAFALPEAACRETGGDDDYRAGEAPSFSFDVVFAENVAADKGGAIFLIAEAKTFAMEAVFRGNVALGASDGGGVAYLDTATTFEADACVFDGNRAARGPGGAVHGTADSTLRLRDSRGVNNTAHLGGGFGAFHDAKRVDIRDSVLEANGVRATGDGGGGGLELRRTTAIIVASTLRRNLNLAPRHCGGAIAAADSTLSLSGVLFHGNVAANGGHGGGLSVAQGATTFFQEDGGVDGGDTASPSSSVADDDGDDDDDPLHGDVTCSNVEVVFDYTTTEHVCGRYIKSQKDLCDYVPNRCELFVDEVNPLYPNRTDVALCAGCACPSEVIKYFLLKDAGTGEVVLKGMGRARSVRVQSTCLADGNYTIQGFDDLGEAWWGASVYVVVHDEDEEHNATTDAAAQNRGGRHYELPRPWPSGFNSTAVAFGVRRKTSTAASKNELAWNSAPNGGGGGVYWTGSADQPKGLAAVLMVGNNASYGADTATEARRLVLGTTTTTTTLPQHEGGLDGDLGGGGGGTTTTTTTGLEEEVSYERLSSPLLATSRAVVDPPVTVRIIDFYNATVRSDSATSIFATTRSQAAAVPPYYLPGRNDPPLTEGLDSTQGAVVVAGHGVATFDRLAFVTTKSDIDFDLEFTATALALSSDPISLSVRLPPKPRERDASQLSPTLRAFVHFLVLANLVLTASFAAWTWLYRKRLIVQLSQPFKLYWLCIGCAMSTLSSVAPLYGSSNTACQLMVWLYGAGFVITTSALYIKMQSMRNMIERSLRGLKTMDPRLRQKVVVVGLYAGGELIILTAWAVLAPLHYKRSCTEKESGGPWDGTCIESVGKCRTTEGPAFVAVLAVYHACCVLAGMHMCYRVRNLPSLMAEGKWVFTGFYSQLQVFVTAVPVLAMVKNDYKTFTVLKSLVICVGDTGTLAMIYVPKMVLIYKYGDFSRTAVAAHIARTLASCTERDTVYEQLRVVAASPTKRRSFSMVRPEATKKLLRKVGFASRKHLSFTSRSGALGLLTSPKVGPKAVLPLDQRMNNNKGDSADAAPVVVMPPANQHRDDADFLSSEGTTNSSLGRVERLLSLQATEAGSRVAYGSTTANFVEPYTSRALATPRTRRPTPQRYGAGGVVMGGPSHRNMASSQSAGCGGGGLSSATNTAHAAERVLDKTNHYLNHEIKNRLHLLADPDCERDTRLCVVDELLEIISKNSGVLRLASSRYIARLEDVDLAALIEIRLGRYRTASHPVVRAPTAGDAADKEGSLLLDRTLINIILDNVLSNAFKYGDGATAPTMELAVEAIPADRTGGTVAVRLDVTNAAGAEHARLLRLGEAELNRIAAADGERAHAAHKAASSAGDGFPMAIASAKILGGHLWLHLGEESTTARLVLPRVELGAVSIADARRTRDSLENLQRVAEGERLPDLPPPLLLPPPMLPRGVAGLRLALVDDSSLQRMRVLKIFRGAFPDSADVFTAGHDAASIDTFARDVVAWNCDLVLTDQNFGLVHHKLGTELVAEIRALDARHGVSRLIYVSSANDNPEDVEEYFAAGADGVISKSVTIDQFRTIVCERAANDPRFKGRLQFNVGGVLSTTQTPSSASAQRPPPQRSLRLEPIPDSPLKSPVTHRMHLYQHETLNSF